MTTVTAGFLEIESGITASGTGEAVVFEGFSDSFVDVRPHIRLTLDLVAGAGGCNVAVNYKSTENGAVKTLLADAPYTGSVNILSAADIEMAGFVQVYITGLVGEVQTFSFLAK
jgi:hypothetical protein